MKPFLGIDLTRNIVTNNVSEQCNGREFLVMQPSAAMAQALAEAFDKADKVARQAKMPLWLRVTQAVCGWLGAVCLMGLLRAFAKVTIVQGYINAPWAYWLTGVSLLIWIVLRYLSAQRAKEAFANPEGIRALTALQEAQAAVYADLAVPEDAKEVDVLSFFYKIKKGRIKVCEKGMQTAAYFNPVFKAFSDGENLYLANVEGKYAFPLSACAAIRTVKKQITIVSWNKSVPMDAGEYEKYNLREDRYQRFHCKFYHILEVRHSTKSCDIYIPCYELPVFEELTGLKAQSSS